MNQEIENFIRYEAVRVYGKYNMITESDRAAYAAGLSLEDYQHVQLAYSQIKEEIENLRTKPEFEEEYTEKFKRMWNFVSFYEKRQEENAKMMKDLNLDTAKEIVDKALSEPAPF